MRLIGTCMLLPLIQGVVSSALGPGLAKIIGGRGLSR